MHTGAAGAVVCRQGGGHISDVSQGPGWWLASDGRWYPPESRPAPAAPPLVSPVAEGQPLPPFQAGTVMVPADRIASGMPAAPAAPGAPGGVRPPATAGSGTWASSAGPPTLREPTPRIARPAGSAAWSNYGEYRSQHELYGAHRSTSRGTGAPLGARDPRGLVAAAFSLVAFCLALLPWYTLTSATAADIPLHLYSTAYRSWYLLIPAAAASGVLIGAANAFMRPSQRGSVPLFVTMQGLALITIGTIVAALLVHHPHLAANASATVKLRWPAFGALAASVIALVATLASGFSQKSD